MKSLKILIFIFGISLAILGGEILYFKHQNDSYRKEIQNTSENERKVLLAEFLNKERQLNEDYDQKKYLAIGKSVFDRIFNTQGQSINDLIKNLAVESLPNGWTCDVRVEEFTHFALLIFLPHNSERVSGTKIIEYIHPVLNYCDQFLSDIAVFDRTHKCYLFFDRKLIDNIKRNKIVSVPELKQAESRGLSFTMFNSATIQCKKSQSHLFIPIEVMGKVGIERVYALFDTGASITMLSHKIIAGTDTDDLNTAPKKTFETANGRVQRPIVIREILVGDYRRKIEVAIDVNSEINLIGMNYFEGLRYIVDPEASEIYVWEK
jgi:predicted aspartyl protease